eukprot:CAMPEP_0175088546 /NCGR_PEP_ID=MMETSP0086_2-20121207/305_1 /TAXON_ID=136419 /ORGANISM="Unknown Unknown, Strain D1" /LENGTH=152 /DNA_ID=CAMNT_0016360985 /DNA_START=407 /DNA_END=862 /DNA_ORIENTATION=-
MSSYTGCPMGLPSEQEKDAKQTEPSDKDVSHFVPAVPVDSPVPGEGDEIPGILIPSTAVGILKVYAPQLLTRTHTLTHEHILKNTQMAAHWANPSANQLFRALKRKNKPIPEKHAMSVGMVHAAVTDMSWNAVLEYEDLHKAKCPTPKLARF